MSIHRINLHLVSDATGETLNSIARATVTQFEHVSIVYHRWSLIRTRFQLHRVLEGIEAEPGPVLSTVIDRALRAVIEEAVEKKARLVEIIPGKGSGQLKKRVLRFLDQKEVKALYDRVEKDSHNFGRVFVHFRPK